MGGVLAAEDFDDGRTDVPGGVAGAVERVLVVGAGIAGLAVANALTHAGVECVVLEGRDRADGRLHTVDLGGSPVDLGGSWIHMPDGNPLSAIARLAGVSCASADPVPEMAGFDCAEGRRLTEIEAADLLGLYLGGFPQAAEGLLADLGAAASMDGAIEAFVAAAGLAPGPARRARQMLYAGIEAESAGPAGQQSLRWMWNELEYGGTPRLRLRAGPGLLHFPQRGRAPGGRRCGRLGSLGAWHARRGDRPPVSGAGRGCRHLVGERPMDAGRVHAHPAGGQPS